MKNRLWLLAIPGVVVMSGCTREIPPASVGVKFDARSGVSQKLLKPQVVWVNPGQHVIVYPTSIKNASYVQNAKEGERKGDDSIHTSTSEGAILPVDVTVAYHVDPENVVAAFENFGTSDLGEIQTVFIRWTTIYGVNVVSGTKSIFDLTSKERAKFGPDVKAVIAPKLKEWGITVDDVYIGEVHPSQEVLKKVEERIATRNRLELAKIELQQATIDAKTLITNAMKEADLNRLRALQDEKSIALRKMSLQKAAITKWNGKPPVVGDGTIPFTDIQIK